MSDDMDSPPEREMKDFQFQQMKKARVFDTPDDLPKDRSSLLTVSNKFGLTFVALERTFKVYVTHDILATNRADGNANEIVTGIPAVAEVNVELALHHLALSCDELTLSVCGTSEETGLAITFYDVRTFMNRTRPQKLPFALLQPAVAPGTSVQDLKWNPTHASMLAVCLSDGCMKILDVGDAVKVQAELPAASGITCICWSPKGKQVAAGKMNATVSQYTPALEEKKVIQCPHFYTNEPVKALDVLWLRTFVFAVVYAAADESLETPPELVLISLPKKDEKVEAKYVNFSESVFGSCTERQHHYFLSQVEDWDLMFAASAVAIEVTVIARQDDKLWELWLLEDASRAELPVTNSNDDTFPLGVAIDYTNQQTVFITEEKFLPPVPVMLMLSTEGLLCPFALLNLNPGVKQLVSPPTALSLERERLPPPGLAPQRSKAAVSITPAPPAFPSLSLTSLAAPSPAAPATPFSSAPFSNAPLSLVSSSSSPAPSGFSFTLPNAGFSTAPSAFSLGTSTPLSTASSGFSFAPKPPSETSSAPSAFSFNALSKPQAGNTTAAAAAPAPNITPLPQSIAAASPPTVKLNLNERFSAVESKAPAFSFISQPKPSPPISSGLMAPVIPAAKPPPTLTPVGPVQISTPPTALQKPSSAAMVRTQPPQTSVSVKALEKQLQQKKDSDPIMVGIAEEIAHFQKELDDLKSRSANIGFKVGTGEEMRSLRKDSDDLHVFTLEIKETTESLHGDVGTLKNTVLEGFAWAEEAKVQSEFSNNKTYRQLLYKKPLDPRNEEQLKDIRRLYQYVKCAVEDVNAVLDGEWEKHLEKKKKQKHMVVPGREGLYNTLSNNQYIINQQKNRLDQLVKELSSLRLYNKSAAATHQNSSTTSTASMESELECLRDALLKAKLDTTPPKAESQSPENKILPGKQSQLRNFLSKRQMPPVRSTAPANLSRSAFLSPKYYEDLDEVSSTSSLPQSLEPHLDHLVLEEEELQPLRPSIPAMTTPRHPTVVRTPSIQPGFGAIQSTPLAKMQSLHGLGISPIPSPVPSNKINLSGADSTALATRTVKHGAPPTEMALPGVISAQQAAATAALRRQMAQKGFSSPFIVPLASQPGAVFGQEQLASNGSVLSSTAAAGFTSMAGKMSEDSVNKSLFGSTGGFGHSTAVANPSLTESSFKVVPPVVNVQDLIDKGSGGASSNISSTVPDPVSQVFTTISSNHAKRNPPQVVQKVPCESPSGFVFALQKSDSSSVEQSSSKGFSTGSAGFSFTSLTQGAPAFGSSSSEQPGSIFGQKPQSIPSSTSIAGSSAEGGFLGGFGNKSIEDTTNKNLFSTMGGFGQSNQPASPTLNLNEANEEAKENSNIDVQPLKPTSGETLGVFSGLRVGHGEEVKDTSSTPAAFSFGDAAAGLGKDTVPFSFSTSLLKPVEESAEGDSLKVASSGSLFKPPESSTKPAFSVPHTSALPTSLSSLLSAPPDYPEELKALPQSSDPTSPPEREPPQETPSFLGGAEPAGDVSATAVATEPTPALLLAAPVPSLGPPPSYTAPTEATPAAPDSVVPNYTPAAPEPSGTTATTAPVSQDAPAEFQAPVSDKPGSIFTQSAPVTTDSSSLEVTPIINTAAPSGPVSTTITVTSAPSTAADTVFGQPTGTAPASSAPAQTTGFGAAAFGTQAGTGFGTAVFGQVSGFGQPATANSSTTASGFTFGQLPFGESSSGTTSGGGGGGGGGGGLFGAATVSNASSFSFGTGSANTASSTGSFGQTMPAFGQSSGFGQGSVFGSNTTTSSSTGFGFGQPAAFGSSFNSPGFGQQGTVFGQQQQQIPSGGGLFGSSSTSAAGSSPGGGFFSGLGGKPTEDAANKNPFGATAPTGGFGQPAQLGSNTLFGSSGAKGFSFAQPAFSEQKSSGIFSTGGDSVASQGFGSFSSPAKSGGFGSAPVFGSPPSFGASPGFGSTATFGSAPAFNSAIPPSAGKVFGEGTAASNMGGFGFASPPSAPSFGALANQSAPSFGTLAQQGPGFGSQPSSFQGFGQQPQTGGFSGNTFGAANQPGSQTFASWRS